MEYNDSETSNSESSSFNSEYEENETLSNQKSDTEFSSNKPEQPISKGKYKYQNIPSYLHIPKEFGMESMRLLVAEKLYPLCPTTEYHDMPLSEINKCIDKFRKKSIFSRTVSDWEERSTLSDKTQKTLKSRKPNGNSKRFKKRKVVESNDEINEEEQQTSVSTNNCAVDRVIQQKSEEERETDQEVSQVKDHGDEERETDEHEDDQEAPQVKHCGRKRKTTQKLHNNKKQEEIPQVRRSNRKCNITQQKNDDNKQKYNKKQRKK
ncbi:unnamed protein product [Rhizophagus irregularis]|nr:unnamed protein product [Rhizophagus irregularis]